MKPQRAQLPLDRLHHRARATGWWLELETTRTVGPHSGRPCKLTLRNQDDPGHALTIRINGNTSAHIQAAARALDKALDEREASPA